MPQDTKDLEERFLSKLLLDPSQICILEIQQDDFSSELVRAAFSSLSDVYQKYGICKDFLFLTGQAMEKLDIFQNGPVRPHKYLDRISRLESTTQGLDCLAAQIKANSPRVQKEMAQEVANAITGRILTALQHSREGLNKTEINNLFGRHKTRAQLHKAINYLINYGLISSTIKRTPGRPVEQFKAK